MEKLEKQMDALLRLCAAETEEERTAAPGAAEDT